MTELLITLSLVLLRMGDGRECQAFAVSQTQAVSALHCAHGELNLLDPETGEVYPVESWQRIAHLDAVILNAPTWRGKPTAAVAPPHPGSKVCAVSTMGMACGSAVWMGRFGAKGILETKGMVSDGLRPGFSGSPCVDSRGRAFGVLSNGSNPGEGDHAVCMAIPQG